MNKRWLSGLVLVLLVAVSLPHHVQAKAGGGVTISPAQQAITIEPDQANKTFNFLITNNDPEIQEFRLSAVDFGSLDDTGGILFLGPQKALSYKYGLANWVTLEKDAVVLQPHETQKVLVTIDNKESLAPGGHYGAILVTPTLEGNDRTKVQVNQVASSLVFLTKDGGAIYNMKLSNYSVNGRFFSLPDTVRARFQNIGNVHVIPRGIVTITDPLGRTVKRGVINPDSGLALPESFREIVSPLGGITSAYVPGKYHVHMTYYYQGQPGQRQAQEITFFYINGWYLIILVILITLIIYFRTHRSQWQNLRSKIKLPKLPRHL